MAAPPGTNLVLVHKMRESIDLVLLALGIIFLPGYNWRIILQFSECCQSGEKCCSSAAGTSVEGGRRDLSTENKLVAWVWVPFVEKISLQIAVCSRSALFSLPYWSGSHKSWYDSFLSSSFRLTGCAGKRSVRFVWIWTCKLKDTWTWRAEWKKTFKANQSYLQDCMLAYLCFLLSE